MVQGFDASDAIPSYVLFQPYLLSLATTPGALGRGQSVSLNVGPPREYG